MNRETVRFHEIRQIQKNKSYHVLTQIRNEDLNFSIYLYIYVGNKREKEILRDEEEVQGNVENRQDNVKYMQKAEGRKKRTSKERSSEKEGNRRK